MNTSNPSSVSPLPCSILDAVSQSATVSVCREGEREQKNEEGEEGERRQKGWGGRGKEVEDE